MNLSVTFGARALVGANDGLDARACAERYAIALRDAIATKYPEHGVEVTFTDDRAPTTAAAPDPAIERDLLDLAWVIKQMHPWAQEESSEEPSLEPE